jgi:hypothetical protein
VFFNFFESCQTRAVEKMDYATRNKRFLAEACEANGLPAIGSPAELFATLSSRSTVGVKRVKPLDLGPLIGPRCHDAMGFSCFFQT